MPQTQKSPDIERCFVQYQGLSLIPIQKACAEYAPTEEFPETFYKEVVSKVILYRDTHIEFKLQNGQIV
jgi:hypothetical protein